MTKNTITTGLRPNASAKNPKLPYPRMAPALYTA